MERTFSTWLTLLICINIGSQEVWCRFPSSLLSGQRFAQDLFGKADENSNVKDVPSSQPQELPETNVQRQRPQSGSNNEISTSTTSDVRRQRINSPPTSSLYPREDNALMNPAALGNPWARWGMQIANAAIQHAMQRSTNPWWNMWFRMNPMLSSWDPYIRNSPYETGNAFAPGQFGQYFGSNGMYQPDQYGESYPSYPSESQGRYPMYNQQPSASPYYYSNPPVESNFQSPSRTYYGGQRGASNVQQQRVLPSEQRKYRIERVESNGQPQTLTFSTQRPNSNAQSFLPEQSMIDSNARPLSINAPSGLRYRELSSKSDAKSKPVDSTSEE